MIAVILAAGLSKRFGGMKLLEQIDNKSMVLHVADLVSTLDFEQKLLVYSNKNVLNEIKENCEKSCEFQYLYNNQAHNGQSTSIKLAMENLISTKNHTGIIFFVADQPFIDISIVTKLIEAFSQNKGSIIVPLYGNNRGNPVIFSNKWIEQLKNLEGDVGGRVIIRNHPEEVWEVPISDSNLGKDIDTKDDYTTLLKERN